MSENTEAMHPQILLSSREELILYSLSRFDLILSRQAEGKGGDAIDIVLGVLIDRDANVAEGADLSPYRMFDVAFILGMTPAALGEIVAPMEKYGLITLTIDEEWPENPVIDMTDAGRERGAIIVEIRHGFAERMLAPLSEEERDQLENALRILNESVDPYAGEYFIEEEYVEEEPVEEEPAEEAPAEE